MTDPSQNLAGKIYYRSQIKIKPFKTIYQQIPWDTKYICIHKRKRWMWEKLSLLSVSNISKYKQHLFKNNDIQLKDNEMPIEVSGISCQYKENQERVNGLYTPVPEERKNNEFQVYKKIGNNELWFYPVKQNNREIQWWIGEYHNFKRRRAHGYAHSGKINISKTFCESYIHIHKNWVVYDGPDVQQLKWTPTNFNINKTTNESQKFNTIRNLKSEINTLSNNNNQLLSIIKSFYNNLSLEQKKEHFNDNLKHIFNEANLCSICFSHATLTKCLHFDCIGACKNCRNEHSNGGGGDGTCCACHKPQILECPICIEKHTEQYLKILKCKHCVCWKCFCNSYEAGHPIKKCPICREKI